jgi:hypothetical protein
MSAIILPFYALQTTSLDDTGYRRCHIHQLFNEGVTNVGRSPRDLTRSRLKENEKDIALSPEFLCSGGAAQANVSAFSAVRDPPIHGK